MGGWETARLVWRPTLPESSDGRPLATTVHELFVAFPQQARLVENPYTSIFMRPPIVAALLAFYLLASKPLVRWLRRRRSLRGDAAEIGTGGVFRGFVAVHNLALAAFSAVCAWNSWGVVLEHAATQGLWAVYCDPDGLLWRNGLGAWSLVFYISKYYEFVDTWILVYKGKPASFLQVYHHTGIAFIMWCAVASQSAWLLFVVLLNAMIHTAMYTYFFIKTVAPKTEIKAARYLTMAQIGQFLTGIVCTIPIFFWGERCDTESSRFALACLHIYGFGLIALFVLFARRKYKKS